MLSLFRTRTPPTAPPAIPDPAAPDTRRPVPAVVASWPWPSPG